MRNIWNAKQNRWIAHWKYWMCRSLSQNRLPILRCVAFFDVFFLQFRDWEEIFNLFHRCTWKCTASHCWHPDHTWNYNSLTETFVSSSPVECRYFSIYNSIIPRTTLICHSSVQLNRYDWITQTIFMSLNSCNCLCCFRATITSKIFHTILQIICHCCLLDDIDTNWK